MPTRAGFQSSTPSRAAHQPIGRRPPVTVTRKANALWAGLALNGRRPVSVSQPSDASEREADRMADSIMRMPAGGVPTMAGLSSHAPGVVQRKCAACEAGGTPCPTCEDEAGGAFVHRKADGPGGGLTASFAGPLGSGAPLDTASRAFFEPRFGHGFGDVRVHAGTEAHTAARSLHSRAFTVGSHVVFAAGEYQPQSGRGRELLAHELTHVVQQQGGLPRVQRSLVVDPTQPTDPLDPLSTTPPATFPALAFAEADHVVHSLCDAFNVDPAGAVVSNPPDLCDDPDGVASGGRPIGCCCLCALTEAGSGPWTILFTGLGGPRTEHGATPGGRVFLHPRTSNVDFGNWTTGGARETIDPIIVAGHELCGHAALLELDVHPANRERVDTDVHDPTVKIQNLLLAEQGLPGTPRGLATDPHRGESFARVTIRNFPFNNAGLGGLPSAERDKIQLAKDFINANNTWVDLFGHSDLVGSASAKMDISVRRANTMVTALTTGTRPISTTITRRFTGTGAAGTGTVTVSGPRITKVEGRSDFDAIPGAAPEDLRRVDIVMPTRPAGAEVPPAGTPTATARIGPDSPASFISRLFFGNACQQLLTRSAWF